MDIQELGVHTQLRHSLSEESSLHSVEPHGCSCWQTGWWWLYRSSWRDVGKGYSNDGLENLNENFVCTPPRIQNWGIVWLQILKGFLKSF